jgi:hypothetical protein
MADPADSQFLALQQQLEEARDEAELNLLQLQQVQEELEFYFLAHQQQAEELARYRQLLQHTEALVDAVLQRLEASPA